MSRFARLFLEALRLDRDPVEAARERAWRALEAGVGGFILFGGEAAAVARLLEELRSAAGRPLWLGADLERGAGQQFRGATELPPPAALAAHPRPAEAVRAAATRTALEARALGLNWVFAPVLDLDVEPRNPIVGTRSFGADPEWVADLGRRWVEACQAAGVAACAKHFPGHGRTTADSHAELPVVDAPAEALEADLAPFAAVAGSVASVMTAHVAYPALGAPRAATASPEVLRGLLRGRLGFEGLVVTDAMIMEGFRDGAEGTAAARALAAGCDLLLYPEDLGGAAAAVEEAAAADPAVRQAAGEALARSEALLTRFGGGDATTGMGGVGPVPEEGADEEALGIARATLLDRTGDLALPRPDRPLAVDVVSDDPARPEGLPPALAADREGVGPDAAPAFGAAFREELAARGWTVTAPGAPEDREGGAVAPGGRVVLVAATPRGWKRRALLPEAAVEAVRARAAAANGGTAAPVIVFGHPRVLEQLGLPGACAWSTEALMERAAAGWLDGRARGVQAAGERRDGDLARPERRGGDPSNRGRRDGGRA